ncbi:hypothetical protein [Streptomyces sp. NPDC056982]|uniref:hypothetical protein n=1 Tax=Streptomyces sp. NPDC056982 TaxID=3345986 RepID=UPI0036344B45
MLTLPDTSGIIPNELIVFLPMGPGEYVEDGPTMRLQRRDIEAFTDADLDALIAARIAPYRAAHPEWRIEAHTGWTFGTVDDKNIVIQQEPASADPQPDPEPVPVEPDPGGSTEPPGSSEPA